MLKKLRTFKLERGWAGEKGEERTANSSTNDYKGVEEEGKGKL